MNRFSLRTIGAILQLLLLLDSKDLKGTEVLYVDRVAFDAASAGPIQIVNFDSAPTGNVTSGSSIGGVTFVYDFGSVSLNVTNAFDTTSPQNSLGTNDGNLLQDGDNINFSFAPRTGFGLYVISADDLQNNDVRLTVGGATAFLAAASVQQTLPDSSKVWFLGVQSDNGTTYTSASLTTNGGGFFLYNLDDVVLTPVPEPGTWALIACAAAAMLVRSRSSGCSGGRRSSSVDSMKRKDERQ